MSTQALLKAAMSTNLVPTKDLLHSGTSASSLPALPTELITQIFKSTDNFATATALSSTSRKFQSIWKTDSASICYAILVRTIPCYDQAFGYVKAQPLDTASLEQTDNTAPLASKVAKQFCETADIASRALQYYEVDVLKCDAFHSDMGLSRLTEVQGTYFLQAWYRIHTLAISASDRLPYEMLASLYLSEFRQMTEVLRWLMYFCPNEHRSELRITYQNGQLEGLLWHRRLPKSPISAQHWYDLAIRLDSLRADLNDTTLMERIMETFQQRERSNWNFMVHKTYLDIERTGKGVSLADTLPLIKERDISDQKYKLSSWEQTQ